MPTMLRLEALLHLSRLNLKAYTKTEAFLKEISSFHYLKVHIFLQNMKRKEKLYIEKACLCGTYQTRLGSLER